MINFRENVKKMAGYVPGEQPPPGSRVVKLNTNENPYPPSPEVMKVLHGFEGEWLRRYPDPMALMADPAQIRAEAQKVLESFGVPQPGAGHVFNLGHGVLPDTDPDLITFAVEAVDRYGKPFEGRPAR